MKYRGIAIVDDDNLFRHILKAQISKLQASEDVVLFENGDQAIRHLRSAIEDPELFFPKTIFLDINMPVMNGWEFLDAFRELKGQLAEEITIFIVTSSVNEEDQQKAKEYSEVSKYVVKPITSAILKEIIAEFPQVMG